MPRFPIDRATNFIIEEESWSVVEYDHTSVPGVIYLSLTENKINLIYDDLENNIADMDKLAQYTVAIPEEKQKFIIGEIVDPVFTLMKNGYPFQTDVDFSSEDNNIVKFIDGRLTAIGEGETNIIITIKNAPNTFVKVPVQITAAEVEFSAYIDGQESVRLNRTSTYTLIGTSDIIDTVEFSLNNDYAKIKEITTNSCVIQANNKNLLGTTILTATYHGQSYSKEIRIIPLW